MKIKRGNLLTVILAMLCAAAVALGVGFALPKNEVKTARAASSLPIAESDLNALATAAGYSSLLNLQRDLIDNSNSLNASDFGTSCIINFGGRDWWPVYATAKDGNAVLTLWLKDSIGNYPWTDGTHSNVATNPNSNNYATSWIHAAINAGQTSYGYYYGSWVTHSSTAPTRYANSQKSSAAPSAPTAFTTLAAFASGGSYDDYILPAGTVAFGSDKNESVSYIGTGYSSEWTSDNLFLPSLAEAKSGGEWGCKSAHWQNSSGDQWLRTGYSSSYYDVSALNTSASISNRGTDNNFAIRPAVHVNLSKFVVGPNDVEVTYNGSGLARNINDSEIDADDIKWFDSSLMDLTYPTANPTDMIDADTYSVKVELNSTAQAAGYKFLGEPDSGKGENDTVRYFNFKIKPKKLTVPGITNSPQTYDSTNGNSFTVDSNFDSTTMNALTVPAGSSDITWNSGNKCFDVTKAGTYTVKFELKDKDNYVWNIGANGTTADQTATLKLEPKKLKVPTVQNTTQTYDPTKSGCYFSVTSLDSNTMNATPGATSTDIIWNAASTRFEATKAGTHTVQFVLKNKDNYLWDVGANGTTDDQTTTVKVNPNPLTIPTITAPQEYTGNALTFVLSNFNSGTYISMDGVTATNGSTVTGASGAAISDTTDRFEATKVDTYTVSLSLRDTTNYAWSDGTTLSKDIDFEITQKELLSTPPVSSKVNGTGGAEWEFGDSSVTITLTDARVTGENINLLFYYDDTSNTLSGTFDGTKTTITMPANIAVGDHTFYVVLNNTMGDNANYKITKNNTLNFKVTSGKLDPSTYGWIYTKDGAAGGTIADGGKLPFELKAGSATDGVTYELSIQIPSSDSFVTVDTSKYTAGYSTRSGDSVNTFKTVVALKSTDTNNLFEVNGNKQDTCEVELNWEIVKGTFNLTNVKWEYSLNGSTGWTDYNSSKPPQYNDGYDIKIRVKASTLPLGLTLDSLYDGSKESAVGNYTATIQASDFNYDTNNFNAPNTSSLDLNWQIAKKNLFKGFKNVSESFSNAQYSGNMIIKQLDLDSTFAGYVDYTYYDLDNGSTIVTLQDIKDAVDLTNPHNYKVEAKIKTAYAANYTVDDNGSTPSAQFKTGSNNKLANAAIDNATAVYDGNTHFDKTHVTVISSSDSVNVSDFTVKYYKGTSPVAANALAAGDLPKDAGDYCIEVILGALAENTYILVTDTLTVTIEAKAIAVPTLGEMTFNGAELNFADYLSGDSWTTYGPAGMNIIKVDGKISDRNVGSGNYTTTLEITDSNYKWIDPSTVSTTKATVKYSLAADEVKPTVNGDCTVATYNWNIKPLLVDTTNMWNKGSKGATLNLPQNIKDLIAGGTLEVGYRYYDSDGVFVETPEMKSGRSFTVEAVLGGDDSARNVQFKRSDTDFGAVSKSIDYTVPTSGAAAFLGKVKDALSQTWLGLPIWAWLLIALALIILLIVIIVVAAKRRKTKEEREEKKAQKEEERMRREEEREAERQRREDERRMQQEKLEAERELARAKQEAELEKIRAQAQMTAGAGMASMAMQQQPVQQAQMVDNDFFREMREQMAELRADNKATQAKLAEMQNSQQMPMHPQYPMYQQYQQMPMMPQYGDPTLARLEAQINAMQAEQRARYDAEQRIELAAMRAEQHVDRDSRHSVDLAAMREHFNGKAGYNSLPDYTQPNSIETLGAIVAAALKTMANGETAVTQPVPELPQKTEQSEPVTAKYPPDAVVTTTTTVDTTKSKPVMRSRGEEENFDVDGFYDSIDY